MEIGAESSNCVDSSNQNGKPFIKVVPESRHKFIEASHMNPFLLGLGSKEHMSDLQQRLYP